MVGQYHENITKYHGKPYYVGDLVWLYSPVAAKGKSKKLHHSWLGPYRIIKKLFDVTYWVQHHLNKKKRIVVHFDRLNHINQALIFHMLQIKLTFISAIKDI